jgi:hypothetical protein
MSYARRDAAFVDRLTGALERRGFDVWLDRSDIVGGTAWDASISEALEDAAQVIVVLSPAALESEYVARELALALGRSLRGAAPAPLPPRRPDIRSAARSPLEPRSSPSWSSRRSSSACRRRSGRVRPHRCPPRSPASGSPASSTAGAAPSTSASSSPWTGPSCTDGRVSPLSGGDPGRGGSTATGSRSSSGAWCGWTITSSRLCFAAPITSPE